MEPLNRSPWPFWSPFAHAASTAWGAAAKAVMREALILAALLAWLLVAPALPLLSRLLSLPPLGLLPLMA
jgi:uncharacterized membrane protein YdfJ with MMPL/SSD domain